MEVKKPAVAGTIESSDCMVMVEPGEGGIEFELESPVIHQYGIQIRTVVMEVLGRLEITSAKVKLIDKGALDCTIKARVECALYRSNEQKKGLPWGGAIQ